MTLLRDYQQAIYDEIPRRLMTGPVLVQSPARSGKSKIISETALRIIKAGRIPLVLTHRDKIKKQLVDHCQGVAIDAKTEHVFIATGHCYVAMNQTLIKRPFILSQLTTLANKLVIMTDEAHRGDFNKTFDLLPNAMRIGFTATPAYKWAKFLPKYYKSLIHGLQPRELIERAYITPIDYYEMVSDLSDLKKGSNGEYTEESQFSTFDRAQLYDGLFDKLPQFTFTKAIIFTASKKAADKLNTQCLQHGYKSTVYYSGIKNGSYELAKFTELNECNLLITVSALSEGFDYNGIDLNILWRATTSLPLFIQMAMRGATPKDGKPITTVLDFGGNNSRFGGNSKRIALTMDRDWNALWQPPEKPPRAANGVAAIRNCPACDYIISALARSCSNCGFIIPVEEVKLKEGELLKIQEEVQAQTAAVKATVGRRISTLTAQELALYAKEKDKKNFAMRIAKSKAVTDADFLMQYAEAMQYKQGWLYRQLQTIAEAKQQHELDQAEKNLPPTEYKIEFSDIIIR